MKRFLRYVWTPTEAPPEARARFNLIMHRVTLIAAPPLIALSGISPMFLAPVLLMVLSLKTDVGTSYTNVQAGDIREKEEEE